MTQLQWHYFQKPNNKVCWPWRRNIFPISNFSFFVYVFMLKFDWHSSCTLYYNHKKGNKKTGKKRIEKSSLYPQTMPQHGESNFLKLFFFAFFLLASVRKQSQSWPNGCCAFGQILGSPHATCRMPHTKLMILLVRLVFHDCFCPFFLQLFSFNENPFFTVRCCCYCCFMCFVSLALIFSAASFLFFPASLTISAAYSHLFACPLLFCTAILHSANRSAAFHSLFPHKWTKKAEMMMKVKQKRQ